MTRHSKNCTAHTVYTYYERKNDAHRSGFGTQEIRLGKDSVKALDCCSLCLQPAKDPVVTSDGFLYDRAVVLEYIVSQKAEIQRKLKLYEKQKARLDAEAKMVLKAEKEEEARRFLSMNTLDTHSKASAQAAEAEALASLSNKRNSLDEKASCFWASSSKTNEKLNKELLDKPDTVVRCPMSGKPLKYKDLVGVKFTSFEDDYKVMGFNQNKQVVDREVKYCCAVSKDPLTNATVCVVLKTSGAVVTKEVVDNVIKKEMIDPINGQKMKSTDFIELQRGSLGFADERIVLTAKRWSTIVQFIGYLKLPIYPINSEQIEILQTPQDFFHGLLYHIENAKKRIVLSTLYIGTGALEHELVTALKKAVHERNVKLTILMDATRGLRPCLTTQYYTNNTLLSSSSKNLLESPSSYSSCHFLSPLTHLSNVSILLYSHPSPHKWIRSILPSRWNEIFGVQHIKAYIFDDTIIMSGANLSHEYFTNRQDRTWIFKNVPNLANFYCDLIQNVISKFCYSLCSNGSLIANRNDIMSAHHRSSFRQQFHNDLSSFLMNKHQESMAHINDHQMSSSSSSSSLLSYDSYIIPLLQYGYCNVQYEKEFFNYLFHSINTLKLYKVFLTSGYFNLTTCYENLLVNLLNTTTNDANSNHNNTMNLLCASPMANGFLKSKGLSGYIPLAYREALIKLLQLFHTTNTNYSSSVNVYEYNRPNWTFHAKGLWIEGGDIENEKVDDIGKTTNKMNKHHQQCSYSLSLVGSSNFSYRSLNRDLESQLCVITTNQHLRQSLYRERCHLFSSNYCYPVYLNQLIYQTEYRLPVYIRIILPILRWYM
ncbi:unnamed protein product [Schistosoma turkestanicum]|nr:unnamed protein product [Schistosoma turkestanicum]